MINNLQVGSVIKGIIYTEGKKGNKDEMSSNTKPLNLTIVNQQVERRWCGLSKKIVPKQVLCTVKWVPFAPNAINYIELDKSEVVVSGYFSGCVMSRYKRKDKKVRVAHISTGAEQDTKEEWKKITEEAGIEYSQFKPFGPGQPKAAKVLGVITGDNKLYTVWCKPVLTDLEVIAIDEQQKDYGM